MFFIPIFNSIPNLLFILFSDSIDLLSKCLITGLYYLCLLGYSALVHYMLTGALPTMFILYFSTYPRINSSFLLFFTGRAYNFAFYYEKNVFTTKKKRFMI